MRANMYKEAFVAVAASNTDTADGAQAYARGNQICNVKTAALTIIPIIIKPKPAINALLLLRSEIYLLDRHIQSASNSV